MPLYKSFLKRALDVAVSGLALVVLAVPMAGVALWLSIANEGAGAFFFQNRPGKGGKIFRLVKFKSMNDRRDADGNLLPDGQRLTRAGRFVRSTSIDELPQLWNVLRGDMSLIGPRPLLVEYLPLYSPEQARRHEVRPGITGWAQVNGLRGDTSIEERVKYDLWYIENWSLWLDLKIMIRTALGGMVNREIVKSE